MARKKDEDFDEGERGSSGAMKNDNDDEFEEDEESNSKSKKKGSEWEGEEPELVVEEVDDDEDDEEEGEDEESEENDGNSKRTKKSLKKDRGKEEFVIDEKSIIPAEVSNEMKKSYLDYAMSVIVARALPAVEDGLKPVQRRILYSMSLLGLKPGTQTKKSARIVGDVIGKFHPHGDVAVYDALVRMAQNFSLRYPLVFGQGNFGSIDGDPPAAYRYTEARLAPMAPELLEDLEKETVKFVSNFDNSLKEPELLPAKLPNLLINGASGIAVGMATNIPPHNLTEVCDAITAYIKNQNISIEELCQIVTGPDFPTGGVVSGDMFGLYKDGKGRLILRGKLVNETHKGKDRIVITEIPYLLNKSMLVTQIAGLIQSKRLKDISDLRDESSKGKIRIVLELRKGANPKYVTNTLYKYTRLQDSFNVNFLALVGGQPKVLNLKEVIEEYVKYRRQVITKRVSYDLKKAKERKEIVEGLLIALKSIDKVIDTIKKSKSAQEALDALMAGFKLTKNQAQAVLETKLQQLTSLEQDKLKKEFEDLKQNIEEYEKILANIGEVLKIILKEIKELKDKYGDNRRTQVAKRIGEIAEKDLVQKKEVIITITDKGYCKRMDLKTYKEQRRGGRGVIGSNLVTGDFVKQIIGCSTHDCLLFFTTRGRVFLLKAHEIPEAERYGKGKSLANLIGTRDGEGLSRIIALDTFENYLFMATKKGQVKKVSLASLSKPRSSGLKAINLPEDNSDILIGAERIKAGQEVLLASKKGQAVRFNSNDVREMGRASYGVTGIRLASDDEVVSMEVLNTPEILTITKNGYGKRTAVEDYRKTARGGKGVINVKVSDKTGDVVNTVSVNPTDNIMITTAKGMVIRTNLKNIRVMGRSAQGVRIVRLQEGDKVMDLAKISEFDSNGNNNSNGNGNDDSSSASDSEVVDETLITEDTEDDE